MCLQWPEKIDVIVKTNLANSQNQFAEIVKTNLTNSQNQFDK